ncbi:MAG: TRAP transporter small permease [Ignavibacteria bacterium]|nr:TRAP transporter small permease [Ignavibacteria bacterium]
MKLIFSIEKYLAKIEGILIITMLSAMIVLAFFQVVLRNLFSFGFLWGDPFLRYLVLWVGFLGAVLATKEEKHFGIEFVNRLLSPKMMHLALFIVDLFASVVAFLLLRAALQFLEAGFDEDSLDLFDIHKKYYLMIIPLTFGLISLHYLLRVVRHSYEFLKGEISN